MAKVSTADILVVGGGATGTLAAVAAGPRKQKVLLLESMGFLGGSRTLMGVDTFNSFFRPGEQTYQLVGGISYEVVERLMERKAAFIRQNTFGSGSVVTYDMEQLKIVFEEMVLEAGAELLLHSFVPEAHVQAGSVRNVMVCNKARLNQVDAKGCRISWCNMA